MCGIVGYTGNERAAKFLIGGLESLEYRGYDSAGIAAITDKKISVYKTEGRIENLKNQTENGEKIKGTTGIAHTRWATHGEPSTQNAHPHLSGDGKFAVVHNGIIENYKELKAELEEKGKIFRSGTDTEVIPLLLSEYYKGDILEAVKKTVERLKGAYALGIICEDLEDTLIAVKKFSPLIIGFGANEMLIASSAAALVPKTREVIYMEDGDIALLTPERVRLYTANGEEKKQKISHIDWSVSAAEKGGFEHFMMKEITEQPLALKSTLEPRVNGDEITFEKLNLSDNEIKEINRISIIACGSAYHAGAVGKYVFEGMLRLPTENDLASEYRYRNPVADNNTLVIAISQSGETADTLAALKEAKGRGAKTIAIVNTVGSAIAKAAQGVIYTHAGPEIAVATTKGYTTQLAAIYLLALYLAKRLKTYPAEEIAKLTKELTQLPKTIEKALRSSDEIKKIAGDIKDEQSIFFMGRNMDFAVALEASLKLKEISYIHSEGYAAGELKHGTISLIEKGKWVIALGSNQDLGEKLASNIKEVRARGARVIAFANEGDNRLLDEADKTVFIPKINPLFSPIAEIVPLQLLAYYVALFRGCDIDKPRNLAKSVTVE
ncbi:MAG: glutamine--fructose-6-phosphate transaminase (isomerizing) [Clostridia bacterium]|nr:glutamine--fructose-6-phosphate transaminase (isomerizing) [Clostridia bacterium]